MKKNLRANSPGRERWLNLLLKMKLTVVILLLGLTHAFADAYSQESKISLDVSQEQVIKVLKEIEENSDFRFFFQDEQIDVDRLVSLKLSDGSIDEVLDEMFKSQNVTYKIVNDKMVLLTSGKNPSTTTNTQQRTIKVSGRVMDEAGEPVPGVTVVVEQTRAGVVTDMDGNYSLINVPADGVISFSFVGMVTQDIQIEGRETINVVLEASVEEIDEIVAVGYGTQKKQNLTGSIAVIKADEFKDIPVSNLAESLRGLVPGLNVSGGSQRPGEAASLSVRQSYSWSRDGGSSVPLIIIDDVMQLDPNTGLPTLEQFNMLDPSEIESVTVLKDASAAIYGSRASQGAIIVTTKRGKKGAARISYSGQFSTNDAVSHGKTLTSRQYGHYANALMRDWNGGTEDRNDFFSRDEIYDMTPLDYDWLDEAWSSSLTQRHSVGVSGGTDNVNYYTGVAYFNQGANLGNQDFERWNFRGSIDVKLNSNLKLSSTLSANRGMVERSYTQSNASISSAYANGSRADYGILLHMPHYIPWSSEYNDEAYFVSPFVGPNTSNSAGMINSRQSLAGWNYFANVAGGSGTNEESMAYAANFSLEYDVPFIKGLKLKGTYGINQNSSETSQVQLAYDLLFQRESNTVGTHLWNFDAARAGDDSKFGIGRNEAQPLVMYDTNYSRNYQANFYLSYERTIGDHVISAMGSIERSEGYLSFQRIYYEQPDDPYLGDSSTAGTITDNTYTRKYENASMSYLGRVNYSFKNKYLLQFLFRSDASTKFAPENYWGFFPSASAGWVMSEEDWFKNTFPKLDFFKLRYSFGLTGKDNLRAWSWLQTYNYSNDHGYGFGPDGGELVESLEPSRSPNRDVKWDKTYKNNVGIDARILDDRLGITFDFYYDMGRDMLMTLAEEVGTPISAGGAYAEENYGAINSWGYDGQISWRDNITQDLKYNVSMNFGRGFNKVKRYPNQAVDFEAANVTREGQSTMVPTWGFQTWNETSGGDGILRTQEDIMNYWNYLSENAAAAGVAPQYFNYTDASSIRTGWMAYEDVGGLMNPDGTQAGPNGQIQETQDYVKLVDANSSYGFTTNLGIDYKAFSFKTQLNTSWGEARFIDRVRANSPGARNNLWNPELFWADMYDYNFPQMGRYPVPSEATNLSPSNLWQVSGFRCFVRNIRVSYNLPKRLLAPINVERASLGLQGNNLWDLYNPFPRKYRNMYDSSTTGYPTLRNWSLSLNVSF